MGTPANLIDLIASAGEAELTLVNDRIAALKAEIKAFVDSRKAELDSLRMVRNILDKKVNPRPRAARDLNAQPKKSAGSELANELYDLIAREGSMPSAVAAKKLGKTAAQVGGVAWRSTWFETKNGEISIARTR